MPRLVNGTRGREEVETKGFWYTAPFAVDNATEGTVGEERSLCSLNNSPAIPFNSILLLFLTYLVLGVAHLQGEGLGEATVEALRALDVQ